MKGKSLVAAGLIWGFSASSVFAGGNVSGVSERSELLDRITQVQRDATYRKSVNLDIIENAAMSASASENKKRTTLPTKRKPVKDKRRNNPEQREKKPDVAGRPKTIEEKFNDLKGLRNWNSEKRIGKGSGNFIKGNKKHSSGFRLSRRDAKIFQVIMNARNLEQLSQEQKAGLLSLHRRVLKTYAAKVVLATIQKGEGGGPLIIVGKGKGKPKEFIHIMNNLNLSTHPAYQFPKDMRCFLHNRQLNRCSTASGCYQITKTNFDKYRKHFGLKDFSVETQQIIALELIRTGKARIVAGNYKGRGYVELLKGNINNAIRYGTNDWASSRFSEWGGHKTDYIGDAQAIAKSMKKHQPEKLKNVAFYQSWIDETEAEPNF